MTLVAADVLIPVGEIDGALFYPKLSGTDVTARVTSYLTTGYGKATTAAVEDPATQDEIARTYAYWRAWSDVVNWLTLSPASTSLAGDVSVSYLQTQINQWIVARDGWYVAYLGLIPVAADVPLTGASGAVPTHFIF